MNLKSVLLSLASLLISNSVFACPDLTGNYKSRNKRKEIRVSKDQSGVFKFSDSGAPEMILDAQPRALNGNPGLSYVGSCGKSDITIYMFQGNTELGKMTYTQSQFGVRVQTTGFENNDENYIKQ